MGRYKRHARATDVSGEEKGSERCEAGGGCGADAGCADYRKLDMRLGEILLERKLITGEDLDRALELQRERGDKLGKTLVDMGFVAMRDVLAALADQLGVPLVAIEGPPSVSTE